MFCTKCGNNMPDGAVFCPKCGAPVNAPEQAAPTQPQQSTGWNFAQPQAPVNPQTTPIDVQPEAQAMPNEQTQAQPNAQAEDTQANSWQYQQTSQQPSTGWSQPQGNPMPNASTNNSKIFQILAYVPILFWLPLAFDPENKESRKFSNQGLILLITNVGASLIKYIIVNIALGNTIGRVWGLLGVYTVIAALFSVVVWAITIFCLVCMIIGIIKASQNEYFEIPLIGKFTLIK